MAGVVCCGQTRPLPPAKFNGEMLCTSTVFFFCVLFSFLASLLGINDCFFSLALLCYIFVLLVLLVLCQPAILSWPTCCSGIGQHYTSLLCVLRCVLMYFFCVYSEIWMMSVMFLC